MSSEWKPDGQPDGVPEAGGTMVGLGRVGAPAAAPLPDTGATMVAVPRPQAFGRPDFGVMSMPLPPGVAAPPPEAGGTMVGMARIGVPATYAPPAPAFADPGATMVGVGRVNVPGAFPPPPYAEAGGTMVGLSRVGAPGPAAPPPMAYPEAGGTMVGVPRVGAPAPLPYAEAGGTMVGVARVGAAGAFAFPAPKPSGPPPAYEILRHLGGGELGQVFHARHRADGAEVALRIVRPDLAESPETLEALRGVVAWAPNAIHTHLGKIHALDETASPTLVLEYVPGKLLSQLMQEKGSAPAAAVVDLGVRLTSALAAAHQAGLAHGRVHAGNVVLEAKTGRWVLLDVAQTYAVASLDPAHDLYALGALLYQLATGHDAFEQGTNVAPDPRTWQPRLPAALSALLMRSLAPDPALWFPTAAEFAQALARARGQA